MHALLSFARLGVLALAIGAGLTVGCSQAADTKSGGGTGSDYNVPVNRPSSSSNDSCASDGEGCPCNDLGATEACRAQELKVGSYVDCGGTRTCQRDTGTWSGCVANLNVEGADGGVSSASPVKH